MTSVQSQWSEPETYRISADLAESGATVASGLARGIDAIAHRTALEGSSRTIAALSSEVDVIYPREHAKLDGEIVEHPMSVRPGAQNFPRRTPHDKWSNAGDRRGGDTRGKRRPFNGEPGSGAGHREVFAVPGNIFAPTSHGTNCPIRDSAAKLIIDHRDVLQELNLSYVGQQTEIVGQHIEMTALFPQDENELQALRYVRYEPIHIDEIIRNSALSISTVSSALAMMELKGVIKQTGGMNYI